MSTTTNQTTHYLEHLRKVVDDRGKRAALRRYWSQLLATRPTPSLANFGLSTTNAKPSSPLSMPSIPSTARV